MMHTSFSLLYITIHIYWRRHIAAFQIHMNSVYCVSMTAYGAVCMQLTPIEKHYPNHGLLSVGGDSWI